MFAFRANSWRRVHDFEWVENSRFPFLRSIPNVVLSGQDPPCSFLSEAPRCAPPKQSTALFSSSWDTKRLLSPWPGPTRPAASKGHGCPQGAHRSRSKGSGWKCAPKMGEMWRSNKRSPRRLAWSQCCLRMRFPKLHVSFKVILELQL